GDREIDEAAVLAAAHRLEMLNALARLHAVDDRAFLAAALFGDQGENRPADDFLGPVTEQAFGGWVPAGDDAVEPFADDRIVRAFDERGEMRATFEGRLGRGNRAA